MKENQKIFIAEDEETLAEIYTERFKRAGFNVTYFKNGLELLEGLAKETPDVVLLDIMMPEMNGYEVLGSIHKNFSDQKKKDVLVIVWSNLSNDSEIRKAKEMGATVYLKKIEFSGDDLVKRVSQVIKDNK